MTAVDKAHELIKQYKAVSNPIDCAIATCKQVLSVIDVFPNGLEMTHEIEFWKETLFELENIL